MRSSPLPLPLVLAILGKPPAVGVTAFLGVPALVSIAEASPVIPCRQVAEWLRASNVLTRSDFETGFEVRMARARSASITDDWDLSTENLDLLQGFRYVALGSRLHVEQTRATRDAAQPASDGYRAIGVWTGEAYYSWVDGDDSLSVHALARPGDMLAHGFVFNVMDDRFPCRLHPLARHVEEGTMLGQSIEDGILTHRFALAGVPNHQTQYELRVEAEPPHRLLESTVTVFSLDSRTNRLGPPVVSQSYAVTAWREVRPGRWIPESAEIRGERATSVDPDIPGPVSLMTRIDRTSFRLIHEPGSVDPTIFDVPMPIGVDVTDERLDLSFRVGESWVVLDGVLYELDAPILEHPGEDLAELLRGATPRIPPSDGGRAESTSPGVGRARTDDESSGTPAGRLGLVILAAGIAAVGLWRLRHARNAA